jgi:alkyl hydroperoxide reductase subunit F
MYDVIVIGGGPAGITAAAMAINRRLDTLIIAEKWGGQTAYTMQLQDRETYEVITGEELLSRFRQQLDYLDFCRHFDRVAKAEPADDHFIVQTEDGDQFESLSLIIATGAKPQRLEVQGEERLAGQGLS